MMSCIYEGRVRHRRFAPVANHFSYALFMLYLDLDELPRVFTGRWCWSNEGRALARFRRRDHLKALSGHPDVPLGEAVRTLVRERLGRRPSGPVRLLTHLEYFRYRFNPVSFYYCFDAAADGVDAIVAEINNTPWGEQHCYVLDARRGVSATGQHHFEFAKDFHVSPFMGMNMAYGWHFTPPGRQLAIHMDNFEAGDKVFDATMTLRRTEITGASLARVLAQYPGMTLKVIMAIHWQALRLWWKRCPYHPHPRTVASNHGGAQE